MQFKGIREEPNISDEFDRTNQPITKQTKPNLFRN